ncbi:MAG: hypothetical protein K8R99_12335 [Actinomycetia bacterium]|nr:hypothetical protein [Actinomycetes bacterium]
MTNSPLMGGVGDVAASHHAAISRSQAVASGLGTPQIRRELKRSTLRVGAPNVFLVHGAPTTWHQALMAATLTANGAGIASYRAAARLHGLDGFTADLIEVTVPRGRRVRVPDAIVHQGFVPDTHRVEIDGIPCTSLARTLIDLAQVVTTLELERALDDFQRRGYSLTWLEQMATELHRPGQRGTKLVLAEVAQRRTSGVVRGSWFEKLIELAIASPNLPPLIQQHVIRTEDGDFIAQVDLAFPSVRLGIEAHSRSFHTGTHREVIDQRRENRAIAEGWQFSYLGWADRKSPAQARAFLEKVVARRRRDLGC